MRLMSHVILPAALMISPCRYSQKEKNNGRASYRSAIKSRALAPGCFGFFIDPYADNQALPLPKVICDMNISRLAQGIFAADSIITHRQRLLWATFVAFKVAMPG